MLHPSLIASLKLPVVAAPMFLVSGPELVIAACKSGILGTFPTLNTRSNEQLDSWLTTIRREIGESAPYGVNLIVHHTNKKLSEHLKQVVKHRVPVVITSLGAVKDVIDAVHSYNGIVFHDVTNIHHAAKAVDAGVDGLIAVCAGAGGHSGPASPLAFIPQLRAKFKNITILAAGAISNGAAIRAVQTLGADLAYMGTRFIATKESNAPKDYKSMIASSKSKIKNYPPSYLPVVYTDRVSGVYANFLRESLVKAGMDPEFLSRAEPIKEDFSKLEGNTAWRDIWSAGHGVLEIEDSEPSVKDLVQRLQSEYQAAIAKEQLSMKTWGPKSLL